MRKFALTGLILLLSACALTAPLTQPVTPGTGPQPAVPETAAPSTAQPAAPGSGAIEYVPGSSQKICQLAGETDRQLNQPTVNQTETRFGLVGNDLGYSFEHDGKLFFLFGDTDPTAKFNGKPNGPTSPPRQPGDNDSIAFTTDTTLIPCLKLTFLTSSSGAYKNPVVLDAQGRPAITLRTNEVPIAGVSDGGKMYVIFSTDNDAYPPGPTKGHLGHSTRTVMAVSNDDGNTFHYLYDFSKGSDARFINVAVAAGQDGYLYFWGTQGGDLYRKSAPFLARKPVGSLGSLSPIEYLRGVGSNGSPSFSPNESDSMPLFHDSNGGQVADCMGELSVAWNPSVKRWLMLYNCLNQSSTNPRGIYMRLAEQPWGPWSAPQTIFNEDRDKGYCNFIHRAVTAQNPTPCDNLSGPDRLDQSGGSYGPYLVSRLNSSDAASHTSTFYFTMSTWNPYTEVIMKSTIKVSP